MALHVRSRTFCCCIPVRLGVFIISILGTGLGLLLTIAAIIQLEDIPNDTIQQKLPYIIQIVVYALYAVFSVQAFFAATCKRLQMIKAYAVILMVHVIFSIASGSYSLYHYFQDSPNVVKSCVNGSMNNAKITACEKGEEVVKGVMVGVFVFVWLMEIWGVFIVKSYGEQLEEEVTLRAKGGPW